MATITRVTMGREHHYWFIPLAPGFSTTEAAECQCGATWTKNLDHNRWDTFCEWALNHEPPTIVRATVRCSGRLVRVEAVDGNGVAWCQTCQRYRPTHACEGYDGAWYEFDPHPVYVAVRP